MVNGYLGVVWSNSVFSTEPMDGYQNRMQLNWTLEDGYEHGDWYPFRTKGGVYGETVQLLLTEKLKNRKNYCGWNAGIQVSECA